MRRLIPTLVLAAALGVTACTPPKSAGDVATAVDQVAERYGQARAFAQLVLPFLSPESAARARAAIAAGDKAMATAQAAATLAQQIEANAAIERATREVDAAAKSY